MNFASSAIIGYFFGFSLGVGCALAVMYSIYSGGYRKAVEDSLRRDKPERFRKRIPRALQRIPPEEQTPDARIFDFPKQRPS
jgi:hypothetical protein